MFFELGKRNNTRMIALENIFPGVPNFFIFDAFLSELYQKTQIICIIAWCQTTTTIAISKTLIFFKKRSGKDFLLTGSCFLHPRATQMCWKTLGTFKTHLASVPEGGARPLMHLCMYWYIDRSFSNLFSLFGLWWLMLNSYI